MGFDVRTDFPVLRQMLQYELHAAERYRRFVSVMMVAPGNGFIGLGDSLAGHCRTSDVMAETDMGVAVLMGETDTSGALTAARRYLNFFDNQADLRFSVVTYPSDGGKAEGLLERATRRLGEAMEGEMGAVVCTG